MFRGRAIYKSLYFWVVVGIGTGVVWGVVQPDVAKNLKPFGDAFIKMIKMIIAPIIFCTVVVGIAKMGDMKKVGRVGIKAMLYFWTMTLFALAIGLAVVNLHSPGSGMNIDPAALDASKVQAYAGSAAKMSTVDFLMNIIPATVVDAFAKGDILQVLFFSLLFGLALSSLGERAQAAVKVLDQVSKALFKVVHYIMYAAPFGAFGAMAYVVGAHGIGTLKQLLSLMVSFYATCLLFIFVVLGLVARWAGFSLLKYLKYIQEEIFLVLGTSSSESALPRLMAKLENAGCDQSVVGLVLPMGYSFNLDGTCIYLTMATIFMTQALNLHVGLGDQLYVMLILLLMSKGAAGVTGSGFIVLAAAMQSLGTVPVAALALLLGVDRFMSEARAITNIIGNGLATIVVAKWENALDMDRLKRTFAAKDALTADEPEEALVLQENGGPTNTP